MKVEDEHLVQLFKGPFRQQLDGEWASWRNGYEKIVKRAATASKDEWMAPEFQKMLWDQNPIANVGMGRIVTVEGAYTDTTLAEMLLEARNTGLMGTPEERGAQLQSLFDQILEGVKHHNARRPLARTLRLLSTIFPIDTCCIADEGRLWQVATLLDVPAAKVGFAALHPPIRERLRALFSPISMPLDETGQSMFTWFLWQNYCKKPDPAAVTTGSDDEVATAAKPLALLPASVQRKGLVHVTDNVPLLVSVVREIEQGLSRTDLIGVIQREAPKLKSAGSASNIISQAQGGLALIQLADGAYRPTERGRELLTARDPAVPLQSLLVERIFGVGHLLMALKGKPEGMARKPLTEQLSALVPTRKSLWSGGELINWAIASKLSEIQGGQVFLTEDGAAYADALPSDFLKVWKVEPGETESVGLEGVTDTVEPATVELFNAATWKAVQANFASGTLSSRLILPDGLLAELHAALHATGRKRFVLLAGLSGTGKTTMARAYAEAYCAALGLSDIANRYAQVAVRPDWTDPTGLLGYVNAVVDPPSFQAAEGLNLLLDADRDPSRPYFLCLDEMNLARVEHYFAPFLSAMEGETATLALHGEAEAVGNVQPRIAWPTNLFIFGTVNMDESTYPFSDKVLDRAFAFEFWDVDLEQWSERRLKAGSDAAVVTQVTSCLRRLYAALAPARRHFGYRTADEVLAFCQAGLEALPLERLLDAAVLAKVLPHVRGDDSGPLKAALARMNEALPPAEFPRSLKKLAEMEASLAATGQARFWS